MTKRQKLRVLLYQDATISINLDLIAEMLNHILPDIHFVLGRQSVKLGTVIESPFTFCTLPPAVQHETADSFLSIVATAKRYDNNYFFDAIDNVVILSFAGWDKLTNLPTVNGLIYFLALLLSDYVFGGQRHNISRGCLNDFRWNKADIDFGMSGARFCPECKARLKRLKLSKQQQSIYKGIDLILNDLSTASRKDSSILEYWQSTNKRASFDVFLCHNSSDKKEIRAMSKKLETAGLRAWLDEEQIRPGQSWQAQLEHQIEAVKSAIVFVGTNGIGPWQNMELRAFLEEFARQAKPVIPVILPTCKSVPELPMFLRQIMWVDFRRGRSKQNPIKLLVWGITGKRPG